jgi:hypothetical protein
MTADTTLVLTALVLIPLVVLWMAALFHIVVRRHDLSVPRKAIWSGLVILVPYLGVLLYAALRPPRPPTPTGGEDPTAASTAIEQLAGLVDAHDAGSITDQEFSQRKAAVFGLAGPSD